MAKSADPDQTAPYPVYHKYGLYLIHKVPSKIAADDTFIFFYFYLLKKIRLDVSCESSVRQRIHKKYQVLFSLKNDEKGIYECRLLQS